MKNICLFWCLFLYAGFLYSQTDAVKQLNYWQTNFNRTDQLYTEILDLAGNTSNDTIIYIKSLEALNCIKLGIAQCEAAKINNPDLREDANYMISRSCLQGAWFNQTEQTKHVFTDSLARAFINKCFFLRPTVNSIPYYDLYYRLENIDAFEQTFFEQVFLSFIYALEDNDKETIKKMGELYIDDMYFVYDNKFPANIFTKPELYFEQSRIYLILKELIPLTDDTKKKLDLQVLMLEYMANFYFEQELIDTTFRLNTNELNTIEESESFVINTIKYADDAKSYYMRLADAFYLLNQHQKCIEYFAKAILSNDASKEELKHFIEFSKSIANTNKDKNCIEYCKQQINKACLLYRDKRNVLEDEEELIFLQETFLFVGNIDMADKIQDRIQIKQEELIKQEERKQKMEKFSFRIGFAPLKLIYINKFHQFSVMGDLKINGFEQGFRYCHYNGFEDNYRFGAWMYVPDEKKSSNTYIGNEISYWVTMLNSYEDGLEHRLCLEARVANYKFDTINVNIINREFDYIQFYDWDVNPVGYRYDLSFVYRVTFFAADIFFFEANFALGLGYRHLSTGFNNDIFIIDDVRYSDSRWPKITAPIRFGFRTGIRFF
ncbi:MAG: hypothetical protein PHE33_03625 [Bacteroidales bacterium]|nr:hypothetical protein [Bacteroidales bacterium]